MKGAGKAMRYSSDHKSETRQRVLQEAASEIRAKGPASIAVAGIMARAGLTHGGFYAHFASKDELIAEAISAMFDDAHGRFDRSLAKTDPRAGLLAYVDFYLSARHRDARERGCPLAALSSDLPRLAEEPRARFGRGVATLTGWIAEALIGLGIAEPDREAASMLAELVGALSLSRAVSDGVESDSILERSKAAIKLRYGLIA
ncbi:MAG TPA: TetR/AcrR family transcriptional regulator [Allosphingosinicella sp.]|jgi:TetR/AcrR family transcriptional repressor of nem operon